MRHVNGAQVCDGLGQNEIVRVGKNSGPGLSRLWTKVHETLGQRRRSLVLPNTLAQLSMSRFIQRIFAIKSRNRRKTEEMYKFLAPIFCGRTTPISLRHIVSGAYSPPFGKVWYSSVC